MICLIFSQLNDVCKPSTSSKSFTSFSNYLVHCDLLDESENIFSGEPGSIVECFHLLGSPSTGWTIILKSQPNKKYHQGITSTLWKFLWLMRITSLSISIAFLWRFELEIYFKKWLLLATATKQSKQLILLRLIYKIIFISLTQNFSEASKGVKGFGPIYSNG